MQLSPPLTPTLPRPTKTRAPAMDSPKNKMKSSSSLSSFLPRKFSWSECSYSQGPLNSVCVCVCVCVHAHSPRHACKPGFVHAQSFQYDDAALSARKWGRSLWFSWVEIESGPSQVSSFIRQQRWMKGKGFRVFLPIIMQ